MNRIEKLIRKLCPEGVEFQTLADVCLSKQNIKWKDVHKSTFMYVDLTSVDRVTHKIAETKRIDSKTAPSRAQQLLQIGDVIFATTRPTLQRYCIIDKKYDGQICSTGFCVLRPDTNKILTNFIFHLIGSSEFYEYIDATQKGASYPAISDAEVKGFKIPVPPINVQREIVRVLDSFTGLESQLQAELEVRKKQYAYYRDELMTFGKKIAFKAVGEVGDVTKLAGFEFTAHVKYANQGEIIAIRGLNVKNGYLDLSSVKYIDGSNFTKLSRSKLHVNDMLFTYVGTIGEVALIDEKDKYYLAPNVARIRFTDKKINPVFMRYYFQTHNFIDTQINHYLSTSSLKNLTMVNIRKFQIPIPPIQEQNRIVSILDKFDALVNDTSVGLPAELAARRKQYEYYRNKLLTF